MYYDNSCVDSELIAHVYQLCVGTLRFTSMSIDLWELRDITHMLRIESFNYVHMKNDF